MNKEELLDLIGKRTVTVLPALEGHRFVASDRLQDLGANSIDRSEILMLVLESLSLSMPRVELFGPKNIGELADLLLGKLEALRDAGGRPGLRDGLGAHRRSAS